MNDPDPAPPLSRPFVIQMDGAEDADPAAAPAILDAAPGAVPPVLAGRGGGLAGLSAGVLGALLALIVSASLWNFVAAMMARHAVLGALALGLTALAALILTALAAQEARAWLRQGRIDGLRAAAIAAQDMGAARAATDAIARLYAGRADMAGPRAALAAQQDAVMDPDALLALAEGALMAPLDRAALAEVEAAARQVALVTALVPLALADLGVTLFANLRMIRRLSQIYGGRSGRLGSLRLLRRVAGTVLGAGALALSDDMIGSIAGGGLVSRLSRRFGEGVVNGALSVRLGLAAMEALRPMPFRALPRPKVSATLTRALAGIVTGGGGQAD